jgi:hypothetical protein
MVRAGNLPDASVCPSAIECYHKSTIISFDVGSAPSGAFHWWDIGEYGHVAMATDNGWALMASCRVAESWGDCIGVTPVEPYTASTGAKYLGWSYDYSHSEIADVHGAKRPPPVSETARVHQTKPSASASAAVPASASVDQINVDESDFRYVNLTSGTNTYAQAINYGQTHPTRDGGSWSGWFVKC